MRGASLNCQAATALMLRAVAMDDEPSREAALGRLRGLVASLQSETVQWHKSTAWGLHSTIKRKPKDVKKPVPRLQRGNTFLVYIYVS